MDEYNKLLILAYFKEYRENYSFSEIKRHLGITNMYLYTLLNQLISDELLIYKEYLLTLSLKGRIYIMNNNMDWFKFIEIPDTNINENKWPIDKPYIPKNFSKKINI